ncbi:MAG: glycosyltransferase family A protein [Myxococcota bacterium]
MSVSVIIPCYNSGPFLRESIESALRQTRPPEQVIVIDDGSSDDSASVAASFPQVRLVRQSNQGPSLTRNRGLAEATGEFVVFQDADDRLLPDAIEIGLRALREHPASGFVYGFHRQILADGRALPDPPRRLVTDASYLRTLEGDTLVPPGCAVFRRALVEAVGGFRGEALLSEDYDFYLRLGREAPIHCHNQIVVEYRQHSSNISSHSPSGGLRSAHRALEAQREFVKGRPELERALEHGKRHWGHIFGPGVAFEAIEQLRKGRLATAFSTFALALRWHPRGLVDVAGHYAGRVTGSAAAKRR